VRPRTIVTTQYGERLRPRRQSAAIRRSATRPRTTPLAVAARSTSSKPGSQNTKTRNTIAVPMASAVEIMNRAWSATRRRWRMASDHEATKASSWPKANTFRRANSGVAPSGFRFRAACVVASMRKTSTGTSP
jgi:hypothetical protein